MTTTASVGTEHILLGLFHDGSALGTVPAGAGVTAARSEEPVVAAALAGIAS